jgi:hypothetical protein
MSPPSWIWTCVAVVGIVLLALTTTARLTLLSTRFDTAAVSDADGYERVYTQILPSPQVQAAIRTGLTGLPIDPTYVTANLRVLLPPTVLEQVVRDLVGEYVDVLTGRASSVQLTAALQPVVDNVVSVVRELLPGALASAPQVTATSLAAFDADVRTLFAQLVAGDFDLRLPAIHLDRKSAPKVAKVLTSGLPSDQARALRTQVTPMLLAGDLTNAVATVIPAYLNDAAVHQLAVRAAAGTKLALAELPVDASGAAPHAVLPLSVAWLTAIALLLLAVALVGWVTSGPLRRARDLAVTLGASAIVTLVAGGVIRAVAVDPLAALGRGGLDPATRALVRDIDRNLRSGIAQTFLEQIAIIAAAAIGAALVARGRPAWNRQPRRLTAGLATAFIGAAALVVVALPPANASPACNGSPSLCERRYSQVSFLTSHNAMASSDRGFIGADQDADLTGQLDNGVRALMLDLHYWTTPEQAAPFVAGLDPRTRSAWAPLTRVFQPHPGVWLCHNVCQLGADAAATQLRSLRDWLHSHPDDVVTLILQDDVSPADVQDTLHRAGLDPLLATPPADGRPWPTLGRMIADHHTLVVFTQNAELTTGPVRNFYWLAAETPYAARTVRGLTCSQGRGPVSAPLFLVNNWLTTAEPSRTAALRVNSQDFLLGRVERCEQQRGMRANFVAVDFAQIGQPLNVIDALNALPDPVPVG